METIISIIAPFIGTTLGASLVFLIKDKLNMKIEKILLGFASGVMIAASIWSLILPSLELSSHLDKLSFIPAAIGFVLGIVFLLLLDTFVPHTHIISEENEGPKSNLKKSTKLILAVTLHNIPEGIAVGVVLAGALQGGNSIISLSAAVILAIGIAIQNLPEGAIISLPLTNQGESKKKAFFKGFLSGIVEPLATILTLFIAQFLTPILPYLLSFAAGAMIYVVVEELIPQSQSGEHSNLATIALSIGFILMMILDIIFA